MWILAGSRGSTASRSSGTASRSRSAGLRRRMWSMAVLPATTVSQVVSEGGPRGVIAAQEAEIRLAETQENLRHRVVHLVRPGRSAQAVLHGGEDDPRIALDESVPSLLVATRERFQINTIL